MDLATMRFQLSEYNKIQRMIGRPTLTLEQYAEKQGSLFGDMPDPDKIHSNKRKGRNWKDLETKRQEGFAHTRAPAGMEFDVVTGKRTKPGRFTHKPRYSPGQQSLGLEQPDIPKVKPEPVNPEQAKQQKINRTNQIQKTEASGQGILNLEGMAPKGTNVKRNQPGLRLKFDEKKGLHDPDLKPIPKAPEPKPADPHAATLEAAKPFTEYGPNYNRNIADPYRRYQSAKKRGHGPEMLDHLHDELKQRIDIHGANKAEKANLGEPNAAAHDTISKQLKEMYRDPRHKEGDQEFRRQILDLERQQEHHRPAAIKRAEEEIAAEKAEKSEKAQRQSQPQERPQSNVIKNQESPFIAKDTGEPLEVMGGYKIGEGGKILHDYIDTSKPATKQPINLFGEQEKRDEFKKDWMANPDWSRNMPEGQRAIDQTELDDLNQEAQAAGIEPADPNQSGWVPRQDTPEVPPYEPPESLKINPYEVAGFKDHYEPMGTVYQKSRNRRTKAAERALKREREKAPLFGDQIAGEQPTPEERVQGFEDKEKAARIRDDEKYRSEAVKAMEMLSQLPANEQQQFVDHWNSLDRPRGPENLQSHIKDWQAQKPEYTSNLSRDWSHVADSKARAEIAKHERSLQQNRQWMQEVSAKGNPTDVFESNIAQANRALDELEKKYPRPQAHQTPQQSTPDWFGKEDAQVPKPRNYDHPHFDDPNAVKMDRQGGASLSTHDSLLTDVQQYHDALEREKRKRAEHVDMGQKLGAENDIRHQRQTAMHDREIEALERSKRKAWNQYAKHVQENPREQFADEPTKPSFTEAFENVDKTELDELNQQAEQAGIEPAEEDWHAGYRVKAIGPSEFEGMEEFEYLEGRKKGQRGVRPTRETLDARKKKFDQDWKEQQAGARRLHESQQRQKQTEQPKMDIGTEVSYQDPTPTASGRPGPPKRGKIIGPATGEITATDWKVRFEDGSEDDYSTSELQQLDKQKQTEQPKGLYADSNVPKPGEWHPANFVTIAADDISQLREQDVYRVLDEAPPEHREAMRDYILENRPEFENEVLGVINELEEQDELNQEAKQSGLFGEDYEPGQFDDSEIKDLTGEDRNAPKQKLPKQERQEGLFDTGKETDLQGQELLFEDSEGIDRKELDELDKEAEQAGIEPATTFKSKAGLEFDSQEDADADDRITDAEAEFKRRQQDNRQSLPERDDRSDQEKSLQDWADNFNNVTGDPEGSNSLNLNRAIGFASKQVQRARRDGNDDLARSLEAEIDHFSRILKERGDYSGPPYSDGSYEAAQKEYEPTPSPRERAQQRQIDRREADELAAEAKKAGLESDEAPTKQKKPDQKYFQSSKNDLQDMADAGDTAAQAELDRRSAKRSAVADGKKKMRVATIRDLLDRADEGDQTAIDRLQNVDNPNLNATLRERLDLITGSERPPQQQQQPAADEIAELNQEAEKAGIEPTIPEPAAKKKEAPAPPADSPISQQQMQRLHGMADNDKKVTRKWQRTEAKELINDIRRQYNDKIDAMIENDEHAKAVLNWNSMKFRPNTAATHRAAQVMGLRRKGDAHPSPTNADLKRHVQKAIDEMDHAFRNFQNRLEEERGKRKAAKESDPWKSQRDDEGELDPHKFESMEAFTEATLKEIAEDDDEIYNVLNQGKSLQEVQDRWRDAKGETEEFEAPEQPRRHDEAVAHVATWKAPKPNRGKKYSKAELGEIVRSTQDHYHKQVSKADQEVLDNVAHWLKTQKDSPMRRANVEGWLGEGLGMRGYNQKVSWFGDEMRLGEYYTMGKAENRTPEKVQELYDKYVTEPMKKHAEFMALANNPKWYSKSVDPQEIVDTFANVNDEFAEKLIETVTGKRFPRHREDTDAPTYYQVRDGERPVSDLIEARNAEEADYKERSSQSEVARDDELQTVAKHIEDMMVNGKDIRHLPSLNRSLQEAGLGQINVRHNYRGYEATLEGGTGRFRYPGKAAESREEAINNALTMIGKSGGVNFHENPEAPANAFQSELNELNDVAEAAGVEPVEAPTPNWDTMTAQEIDSHIMGTQSKFKPSRRIEDWGKGKARGQGKRVGGMIMGGMSDAPQGKKSYVDDWFAEVPGLSEEQKDEIKALTAVDDQTWAPMYLRARTAGMDHDQAATFVAGAFDGEGGQAIKDMQAREKAEPVGQAEPASQPDPEPETTAVEDHETPTQPQHPIVKQTQQKIDAMPDGPEKTLFKKVNDFGEKLGGARKHDAPTFGKRAGTPKSKTTKDNRPAWARKFEIRSTHEDYTNKNEIPGIEIKQSNDADVQKARQSDEKFYLWDSKAKTWGGTKGRRVGKQEFDSREEAEQAIALAAVAEKHMAYQEKDGTFSIRRKISDRKRPKIVGGFETREDAMRHMATNAPDILNHDTAVNPATIHPGIDFVERKGPDHRTADAKEKDFERFGMRGVTFGNWVNSHEGQEIMNHTHDSLADLAEVTGLPESAISLGGELGLGFGSHGTGSRGWKIQGPSAFYLPGQAVVALTKNKGAGTLAHEWAHALDHYIARKTGSANDDEFTENADGTRSFKAAKDSDMASHGFAYYNRKYNDRIKATRPELKEAFDGVMDAIHNIDQEVQTQPHRYEKMLSGRREEMNGKIDSLVKSFERDHTEDRYKPYRGKKNNAAPPAAAIKEFRELAEKLKNDDHGEDMDIKTKSKYGGLTVPANLHRMNELFKEHRGKNAYYSRNNSYSGPVADIKWALQHTQRAEQNLAQQKAQTHETKKVPTHFAQEARLMDEGRVSDYYSLKHELLARAFESYVYDKLKSKGQKNDFLAYEIDNNHPRFMTPFGPIKPYPEAEERKRINDAFDRLFKTIKHREEGGKTHLYSAQSTALIERFQLAFESRNAGLLTV
jgi:hypothetical protein